MHALLLMQIVYDRRVPARERLEAFFPPRIREATAIEDKTAAVAGFVLGHFVVKGKTENADDQIVGFGRNAFEFLRSEHVPERAEQRGQLDGQLNIVDQPANVFQGVRHALQEMRSAFEKTAVSDRKSTRLNSSHVTTSRM